jgi:hypothetical protein
VSDFPILDKAKFWETFGELKHLVPSLMATFEKQCTNSLKRIEDALLAADPDELERRGRAGRLEDARELYRQLTGEIGLLLQEIRAL